VLPLARGGEHGAGWCTYTYEHEQAPELEILCGGINSKTPRAGAVWRQGNLLHFGFDLAPSNMTEAGQALLVNAVAYIARFAEDRPIVFTPCVFTQNRRIFDRNAVARLLGRQGSDLKDLQYYLGKDEYEKIKDKSRDEVAAWYKEVRGFLYPNEKGSLTVDAEAQSFGVSPAVPAFFQEAVAALGQADRAALARRLLARYAPDGPGAEATAERWRAWAEENMPYLFFSDTGGYRWYLDPLAKKRQKPTAELRGPARATPQAKERAAR
jgi:hypothetical protein